MILGEVYRWIRGGKLGVGHLLGLVGALLPGAQLVEPSAVTWTFSETLPDLTRANAPSDPTKCKKPLQVPSIFGE